MKKLILLCYALVAVMLVSGCSSVSTKEYNSLAAENSRLKSELAEYKNSDTSVSNSSSTATTSSIPQELTGFEKYVKNNNITLNNIDVQYDMGNNLDKKFTLIGTAELDDYYNYGFGSDMEKDYFCVKVTPDNGSYSNSWYIYVFRVSDDDFFDTLKKKKCEVQMVCYIPEYRYKEGQNNMAYLDYVMYR